MSKLTDGLSASDKQEVLQKQIKEHTKELYRVEIQYEIARELGRVDMEAALIKDMEAYNVSLHVLAKKLKALIDESVEPALNGAVHA